MSRRALIVYGTNLLARGFAMISTDRVSESGEPTNALYGVASSLARALEHKVPDIAVAVLDADADESKLPASQRAQSARLEALLGAHGIHVVRAARAADVVASYVRAAVDDGCSVEIVGSDKRLAQLVGDDVWWYDAYKDVRYTPELVRKRFEVGPANVAEWLALVGDDDTLPGVKGIGKKGATTLIETHGSVAEALADSESVEGRAGKALRAGAESVERELKRAKLVRSLPLPAALDEIAYAEPDHDALQTLYAELGFYELLSSGGDDQLDVQICDTDAAARAAIDRFAAGAVSIEVVFEDPSAVLGELVGAALAQNGRVVYIPIGDEVPAALVALLADPERPIVGHGTKDAVVAFARRGVTVANVAGDSECASHLTEPSNWAPHDLTLVARFVLRRALPEADEVRGVGKRRKRWSAVDRERTASHAGRRADAADKIWRALEPEVAPDLMAEYLALSDTVGRMELVGIAVDGDDLDRAGDDFLRIAGQLEAEVFAIAGKEFNLGSTKQLGSVLFEDLGLPIVKRTKTGWSTATEALERIENAHPIVSLVIRWRRVRRLMDSWVTALGKAISPDGRVHSTFHPARSFSGRLVNSNPDLGRVPGRTPEMARIRHAFAAPPGSSLLSVDYSQLGLFVLAHLTRDPALVEPLSEHGDIHVLTAAAVLDKPAADIDDGDRQLGKIINFATFAGQGASSLAPQLGVSAAEAKQFIARFDRRYSVVRAFQDEQLRLAEERGYIETIAGRRWPIGQLASPDQMLRAYAVRMARRATHEGSVADVSRRGLLRADLALRAARLRAVPLLQVHDEVLFEVPDDELADAARVAADAMRNAFDLVVPLRVGCKAGPNWAELEPLDV